MRGFLCKKSLFGLMLHCLFVFGQCFFITSDRIIKHPPAKFRVLYQVCGKR
jgi:hypothetical protein